MRSPGPRPGHAKGEPPMRAFRTLAALLAVLTLSACGTPAADGSASSAPSGSGPS